MIMKDANMGDKKSIFCISCFFFIKLSQKGGEMSEWIKVGLYCTGIHIVSLFVFVNVD